MFMVGDRVLLRTKELLDATDISKLRARWDGPFTVTACHGAQDVLQTVNVDRLQPFFARAGTQPAPGIRSEAKGRARGGAAAQPPGGARRDPLHCAMTRRLTTNGCSRRSRRTARRRWWSTSPLPNAAAPPAGPDAAPAPDLAAPQPAPPTAGFRLAALA